MRVRAKEGALPSEPSPAVPLEPAVSPPMAATETRPGQTTRRQFLTYGAVGLATATATGAGLFRWGNRSASAQTAPGVRRISLDMTHRIETLVDGTPLYTWVYAPKGGGGGSFPDGAVLPTDKAADGTLAPRQMLHRHWASVFPERVLYMYEDETVELTLTNLLDQPHNWTMREDDSTYFDTGPLAPGETKTYTLKGLTPGTYIFEDDLDSTPKRGLAGVGRQPDGGEHGGVNRSLGLYGVLIVSPTDPWMAISSSGSGVHGGQVEFERQYVWIFNDHDTSWNALAQAGRASEIVIDTHLPSYFTLNGRSGVDSADGPGSGMDTRPCGMVRDPQKGDPGQLIRLVNVGLEIHGAHIHGNHVQLVRRALPFKYDPGDPLEIVPQLAWKDVVPIHPGDRVDVMLPFESPRDCATPPAGGLEFHYPMHSHSEPSQVAGGGLYPGGQLTDWILLT